MSAADLRRAADYLRESAGLCVPAGPWLARGESVEGIPEPCHKPGCEVDHRQFVAYLADAELARYVATMHPGVVLALAKWLDDIAAGWMWDGEEPGVVDLDGDPLTFEESLDTHALTIARLINGGA